MTLDLKCISNVNVKNKPFFSRNLKKEKWLSAIHSILINDSKNNDDELVIVCIQNLYGYRTGLVGYLSTLFTTMLNKCIPSTFIFTSFFNCFFNLKLKCNDLDIFSGIISILNRSIPFLNYGVWDQKKNFANKLNLFVNENHSINNMFDIYSIFLFEPFFDSGLGILSNKKCSESGFEKITIPTNRFVNEGFLWSYFEDGNKHILIVTLNITKKEDNIHDLKELFDLIDKLSLKFPNNCEIYILGDFQMTLNDCKHLFDDEFIILNNDCPEYNSSTNNDTQYLLYKNSNFYKKPDFLKTKLDDDDEILTYNFTKKRNLSPIEKMLSLKKKKYDEEHENKNNFFDLNEIKIISFEEHEKIKDENRINFYKNLKIITQNPISFEDRIENYFDSKLSSGSKKSISSKKSLGTEDDEWTEVDEKQII